MIYTYMVDTVPNEDLIKGTEDGSDRAILLARIAKHNLLAKEFGEKHGN